jgi:hypothetical protein
MCLVAGVWRSSVGSAGKGAERIGFKAMENPVEKKDRSGLKETAPAQIKDLRKGVHGSLTVNSIDAGAAPTAADEDRLASPDFVVPDGQTTHE